MKGSFNLVAPCSALAGVARIMTRLAVFALRVLTTVVRHVHNSRDRVGMFVIV